MIKNLSTIGNIGSVVDITGVTADYDLKIGETALRAYSSVATIPLYIKTNGGIFEFYLEDYIVQPEKQFLMLSRETDIFL